MLAPADDSSDELEGPFALPTVGGSLCVLEPDDTGSCDSNDARAGSDEEEFDRTALKVYRVCRAGNPPCMRLTQWIPSVEDVLCDENGRPKDSRHYCSCLAFYKWMEWDVLVEIVHEMHAYYALAPYPFESLMDPEWYSTVLVQFKKPEYFAFLSTITLVSRRTLLNPTRNVGEYTILTDEIIPAVTWKNLKAQ